MTGLVWQVLAVLANQPLNSGRTETIVLERLSVIKNLTREWKPMLALDPRSGHEDCGDIRNIEIAKQSDRESYVRTDEVACT